MIYKTTEFETRQLQDVMYVDGEKGLSYQIDYPHFQEEECQRFLRRLNRYYQKQALDYEKYCRDVLFKQAAEQHAFQQKNGSPAMEYEAVEKFNVTERENGFLSLYFDRYEITGGAHGNTLRYSDSWNLNQSEHITLDQIFTGPGAKEALLQEIDRQIAEQMNQDACTYFDDYQKNVRETFQKENFYLTPHFVVIYFQQYDIAPYCAGIREFPIPYPAHRNGKE